MSSFAARRAGTGGGEHAGQPGHHGDHDHAGDRDRELGDALAAQRLDDAPRPADREHDTEAGTQRGDQQRLPADRAAELPAMHADGSQQAELPGPLVDRQGQGVGDADQRDDHGEGEQAVDQVQDLADLGRDRLLELGLVLDRGVGPLADRGVDRGPGVAPPTRRRPRRRRPRGRTGRRRAPRRCRDPPGRCRRGWGAGCRTRRRRSARCRCRRRTGTGSGCRRAGPCPAPSSTRRRRRRHGRR